MSSFRSDHGRARPIDGADERDLRGVRRQKPLLVSMAEFEALLGIGKTKAYQLVGSGEVASMKAGSRTLVVYASIEAFIERAVAKAEGDRNA